MTTAQRNTIYNLINESGLLLIRTDIPSHEVLPQFILQELSSTLIYFTGMLRALSATKNPHSGKPYSLYNFHAIESLLLASKHFKSIGKEKKSFLTDRYAHEFSQELYHRIFGVDFHHKELRNISSLLMNLGTEAERMIENDSVEEFKVGCCLIVFEYIDGIPKTYIQTVHLDCKKHKRSIQARPCQQKKSCPTAWTLYLESFAQRDWAKIDILKR